MALTTEIDVRYRDLDTLAHVNNAVFATYLEEARIRYVEEVFGLRPAAWEFAIANLEIDFERAVTRGDDVAVTVSVPQLGASSVPMEYEVTANGDLAATGETTLVFMDEDGTGTTAIPEEVRTRIEEHEGLG